MTTRDLGSARRFGIEILKKIGVRFDHFPSYVAVAEKLQENGADIIFKKDTVAHKKKALLIWYRKCPDFIIKEKPHKLIRLAS